MNVGKIIPVDRLMREVCGLLLVTTGILNTERGLRAKSVDSQSVGETFMCEMNCVSSRLVSVLLRCQLSVLKRSLLVQNESNNW